MAKNKNRHPGRGCLSAEGTGSISIYNQCLMDNTLYFLQHNNSFVMGARGNAFLMNIIIYKILDPVPSKRSLLARDDGLAYIAAIRKLLFYLNGNEKKAFKDADIAFLSLSILIN